MNDATTSGPVGCVPTPFDALALRGASPNLLTAILEMDEATTAGAMGHVPIPTDALALRGAAPDLLAAGLEMDEATTAAAFRSTADAVDRTKADSCNGHVRPP